MTRKLLHFSCLDSDTVELICLDMGIKVRGYKIDMSALTFLFRENHTTL